MMPRARPRVPFLGIPVKLNDRGVRVYTSTAGVWGRKRVDWASRVGILERITQGGTVGWVRWSGNRTMEQIQMVLLLKLQETEPTDDHH